MPGGGFVLIYGDVTKRTRAEEAIRAARDAAETAVIVGNSIRLASEVESGDAFG